MYLPNERGKIEKEFIKVKPEGLNFHQQSFSSLKDLIKWFKGHFRTNEYKQFMRRTKAPYTDTDKNITQMN